jgi:hypothetical protein
MISARDESLNTSWQITTANPKYIGKKFLSTTVGLHNPIYKTVASKVGAGNFLSIGGGSNIHIQRQGNLSYRVSFGIPAPEDQFGTRGTILEDVPAAKEALLSEYYADWADDYKDLIRHGDGLHAWAVRTMKAEDMQWKTIPRLTVAGDAAHVSVIGGQGVNVSMFDALELANKIEELGLDHLDRAVEEYEQGMFARGKKRLAKATFMGDLMHSEDPQAFLKLISGA